MFQAIPETAAPKPYTQIQSLSSAFVCLSDHTAFDVKLQYPLLQLRNAVTRCYVRQEVFDRLLLAQSLLPEGFRFRIWDGWRPFALQKELYEKYASAVLTRCHLTDAALEVQSREVAKYVSYPSEDSLTPPVHTTGGAVDLTILGPDGLELDMGTGFDDFSEKASTAYYEKNNGSPHIRNNRRMLYHCMISAGFQNLPTEWWHYDFGDAFWAYYNHTPALYKGVYDIEELVCK